MKRLLFILDCLKILVEIMVFIVYFPFMAVAWIFSPQLFNKER